MQWKRPQNPETPAFNIRKLNKKNVGIDRNVGEFQHYTPELKHGNYSSNAHGIADPRREKQRMLDQTVSEAITKSKVYENLKATYLESKKKQAEQKVNLLALIAEKKREKNNAKQEQDKLEKEKEKYLKAIVSIKEKLSVLRETNDRYRQSLSAQMQGESDYLSNLIMSMRFQAEYQHNINPDEMTYEELLELEEKIGIVSKGLPIQKIKSLPQYKIEKSLEQKCMVCLSSFEEGEVMTIIPNCKHEFHLECLESWLGRQKVCPLCKQEVQILAVPSQ